MTRIPATGRPIPRPEALLAQMPDFATPSVICRIRSSQIRMESLLLTESVSRYKNGGPHRRLPSKTCTTMHSLNRNTICCDVAIYLLKKFAGRIVKLQGKRSAVGSAVRTNGKGFAEVDRTQKISI
jgi:hypothetical protein